MAARANGAAERAMGDKAISRVVRHQRFGDKAQSQWGRGCFGPPPGLDAPEVNQAGASCSKDSFMPPMRCFGLPPGLDAPEVNQVGTSCSSKDSLRTDQDRPPGLWNEGEKMTPHLQDRLTLEVEKLGRLLRELGGTLGKALMCRPNELARAFALDQTGNGHGLPELAAFILVCLDLIAGLGDEAKRSVREATQTVQDVIILVCCRGLTTEELGSRGMPQVLKQRLAFLFPEYYNTERLSRLGVAKHRVFNDGEKFSRRRARKKNHVVSHAA